MSDVLLSVKAFGSVNYREHLQLLVKSQSCLSAPSSPGKRTREGKGREGKGGEGDWWILSSHHPPRWAAPGMPRGASALHGQLRAARGFESRSPTSVMLPPIPRLQGLPSCKGKSVLTQGTQHLVNGRIHMLKVKHFVKCFCLIRPDVAVPCGIECKVRHARLKLMFSSKKLKMKHIAPSSANN